MKESRCQRREGSCTAAVWIDPHKSVTIDPWATELSSFSGSRRRLRQARRQMRQRESFGTLPRSSADGFEADDIPPVLEVFFVRLRHRWKQAMTSSRKSNGQARTPAAAVGHCHARTSRCSVIVWKARTSVARRGGSGGSQWRRQSSRSIPKA